MYKERKFLGLRIVVYLAFLNSIVTIAHFFMLNRGILNLTNFTGDIFDYALPISITGILPLIFGAFGIYQKRMWGLGFFTLGNGAYLFAAVSLLRLTFQPNPGIMFYAAVYLLVYSILAHLYIWNIRYSLRDY